MELTITTLIENGEDEEKCLNSEHGLALYLEYDGEKILFDTGQTGNFVDNAAVLGKSLNDLDYVVLSHGHYDHGGGVKRLLPLMSSETKIVLGDGYFRSKYKRTAQGYRFNGVSFSEEDLIRGENQIITVRGKMERIGKRLLVFRDFTYRTKFEKVNPNMCIKVEESFVPDEFRDEIVLGVEMEAGLVVIAGCSHAGIVNILEDIRERSGQRIFAVIGGTHLVGAEDERIRLTAERLRNMDIQMLAVSHCTGEKGVEKLREVFGDRFIVNNTGNVITVK